MMKKVILFVLMSAMVLGLTACGHEHTFSEATCTEPKTCTECGEIEGEALGHTVEVGTCANCNETMNQELMEEIKEYCEAINGAEVVLAEYMSIATNEIAPQEGPMLALAAFCHEGQKYIELISDTYQQIYDLCGEYEELAEIKVVAKKVVDTFPTTKEIVDEATYNSFLQEYMTYLQERENALAVLMEIDWLN